MTVVSEIELQENQSVRKEGSAMQVSSTCRNIARSFIGLAVFIAVFSFTAVTVLAVDDGKLSMTAEGVTAARALYHQHPDEQVRNGDYLAMQFVHPAYWHYSLYSKDFALGMEMVKTFRSTVTTYVNARTKHMDGILAAAGKNGIKQMVNLGAGYDSRAYRYHEAMPGVRFFEIELPAMVVEKKRRVKEILGEIPEYVTFVPIDFNTQNIPDELARAGYDPSLKTLFLWEGVTYYISAGAVEATLEFIRDQSAPGSSVVFDYMPLGVIQGNWKKYPDARRLAFYVKYIGEPFVFGVPEGQEQQWIEQRGLKMVSDLDREALEERYLTLGNGKLAGRSNSAFRIMYAVVPEK
jgi:methyltransferase (TIGR00027 family)